MINDKFSDKEYWQGVLETCEYFRKGVAASLMKCYECGSNVKEFYYSFEDTNEICSQCYGH
jgi:homoserine trans-succinylase